jgi:phosphate transport system substrate-binding protein
MHIKNITEVVIKMRNFLKSPAAVIILKIILFLVLEVAVFYGGLWACIFALFSGVKFFILLSILFTSVTLLFIPAFIFVKKIRRLSLKIYMGALAALLIALTGKAFYLALDARVPVVWDQNLEVALYQPFSDNVSKLPAPASIRIDENIPAMDGALALYPLYSAFATAIYPQKKYSPYDYDIDIDSRRYNHEVHYRNTVQGFEALLKGDVDIFFMADLSDNQKDEARELGIELVYTPIGKEAFVFFVNSANPVDSLTIDQIQDIYEGKTIYWQDLGGSGKITAFQRHEGSGSQSALQRFMKGKELMPPPRRDVPGMGEIVTIVSDYKNYKGAIGFSFRYFLTVMAANDGIKPLKINGVAPTRANIADGSYPLTSYFYAITRADNSNPNVPVILEWLQSDEGQYLVEATGYTPIK